MSQFERDLDRIGRAGQAAYAQLKKSKDWNLWLVVGEAMATGRHMAMQGAKVNRPEGRGYNELFSQWLSRYKLSEIDKVTRSHLLIVMEHKSEVEEFRNSLPLSERMRLNHPSVMLRHWRKATAVKKPKVPKPDYQGELDSMAAHVAELEGAREVAKPMPWAGVRELYFAGLSHMPRAQALSELQDMRARLEGWQSSCGFTA